MTTIKEIVMLKRDPNDKKIVTELTRKEGLEYLLANNFCNPHLLVIDKRKIELRKNFFHRYLESTRVHMVNTTLPPHKTQQKIREVLARDNRKIARK